MKLDKETIIVIAACALLIAGWMYFSPGQQTAPAPQPPVPAPVSAPAAAPALPAGKTSLPAALPGTPVPPKPGAFVLSNSFADYRFNSYGRPDEIILKNAQMTGSAKPVEIREISGFEPLALEPVGFTLQSAGAEKLSPLEARSVKVWRNSAGAAVTVVQKFRLSPDSPKLSCTASIESKQVPEIELLAWAGMLPPLEHFSGDKLRDIHRVEYLPAGAGSAVTADPDSKPEKFLKKQTSDPVEWVAVSNKYFVSILLAKNFFSGGVRFMNEKAALPGSDGTAVCNQPRAAGICRALKLPAVLEFDYYIGAKDMRDMRELPASSLKAIHLAYWGWLEPVCRPMLYLLNLLKGITGSYGWSIILLTVLVKLVLWPLIHKSNKSMQKMQKIQPKLNALKEKYKDKPQEFNAKMWELYRQEGASPASGCFPMLLQFPIFVALYSTLDSAVELRHVPFLWAADLSRPDTLGPMIWGFQLHPLMIASTALMLLQMWLSPQTGDATQRKIMMIMPVVMLYFFYDFPSGLALYWTVNNILSILQMKYSQYAAARETADGTSGPAGNKLKKA